MSSAAPSPRKRPEATVRALVVRGRSILLVSDDGSYWYTPGGRIEHGEEAQEALVRELREETGLAARVLGFSHVEQFFKPSKGLHHVNLYFYLETEGDPLPTDSPEDPDGPVTQVRFFTLEELSDITVFPATLREGWWIDGSPNVAAWKGTDRA